MLLCGVLLHKVRFQVCVQYCQKCCGRFPEDFHLNPSGVVSMTLIEVLLIMIMIMIIMIRIMIMIMIIAIISISTIISV